MGELGILDLKLLHLRIIQIAFLVFILRSAYRQIIARRIDESYSAHNSFISHHELINVHAGFLHELG